MISTLKSLEGAGEDLCNPNVVKVVTDQQGYALYFSRSPIPFHQSNSSNFAAEPFFKHIGLYVYRKRFLELLPGLNPSSLEKAEGLEQLRFLENGYKIKDVKYDYQSRDVDTPEVFDRMYELITMLAQGD